MSETVTGSRQVGSSPSPERGGGDASPDDLQQRAPRGRRVTVVGSILTTLAVVALGALGVVGYDAALKVKGGATSEIVTDPAAPGYVAAVDASPVHMVALTDDQDALSAFLLFVPDSSGGPGSIVWCLGELVVDQDGTESALNQVYAGSGIDEARALLERQLGFGATDVTIVGPAQLEAAVATLGELEVNNPDPVVVETKGKRTDRFEAGKITLDPDELGEFVTIRSAGEAPENRSTRSEALFGALIARFAEEPTAVDGSAASSTTADAGPAIATTLAAMGAERPDFIPLPTTRVSFKGSYLYRPDAEAIADRLAGVVTFPLSAYPGQRPRVRILNGTVDVEAANAVAPDVAAAGGEVLLVGNADSFDVETTTVVYSNEEFAEVAARIAEVVGTTAERSEEITDAADVDVVLGADHER